MEVIIVILSILFIFLALGIFIAHAWDEIKSWD